MLTFSERYHGNVALLIAVAVEIGAEYLSNQTETCLLRAGTSNRWRRRTDAPNVPQLYSIIKHITGWSKKTDTQFYFWDNFGNSAPILTTLSLLQA